MNSINNQQKTTPSNDQITVNNGSPLGYHRHKLAWLNFTIAAIVIIVAIVSGIFWHKHSTKKPVIKTSTGIQQSFAKVTKFKLVGTVAGAGATFNKPTEFAGSASEQGHAGFDEVTSNKKNQNVPLGEMYILATPVAQAFTTTYLQNYDKLMVKAATDEKYQRSLHDFVAGQMPPGYTVKVDTVQPFTSTNIKAHAWEIKLTATPTKPAETPYLSTQKGIMLFAVGQKTYYNFMVMVVGYNWQTGQPALQNVFKSLKIDQ